VIVSSVAEVSVGLNRPPHSCETRSQPGSSLSDAKNRARTCTCYYIWQWVRNQQKA